MKSIEELNNLTPAELKDKLSSAQEEYENLILQKATHQLSNPLRLRTVRRNIARLKTFMHQHELGIAQTKQTNE